MSNIIEAIHQNDLEMVKQLLDEGVDINAIYKFKGTALMFAAAKGRLKIVKYLVQRGADHTITYDYLREDTAFKKAIGFDRFDVVLYFVKNLVDVHAVDEYGRNLIVLTNWNCHKRIIKYFIQCGVSLTQKGRYSKCAMDLIKNYGPLHSISRYIMHYPAHRITYTKVMRKLIPKIFHSISLLACENICSFL